VGAILLTTDILPNLAEFRSSEVEKWSESRAYFGSILQSYISVLEIVVLDGWYSEFCQPLILAGRFFSAITILLVVFIGGLAFANLLLGCIVDSAATVSSTEVSKAVNSEMTRKEKVRCTLFRRLTETWIESKESWIGASSAENVTRLMEHDVILSECLLQLKITAEDVDNLIKTIDRDGLSMISLNDCISGFPRIHAEAQGQDIVRINTCLSRAEDVTGLVLDRFGKLESINELTVANLGTLKRSVQQFTNQNIFTMSRLEQDRVRASNRSVFRKKKFMVPLSDDF
jgi:hypothetical protein